MFQRQLDLGGQGLPPNPVDQEAPVLRHRRLPELQGVLVFQRQLDLGGQGNRGLPELQGVLASQLLLQ